MAGDYLKGRFRVRMPGGSLRGFILQPSTWQVAIPFNDLPSLEISYHDNAKLAKLLNYPVEISLELFNPQARKPDGTIYPYGAYEEFPGCRFLNLRQSGTLMTGTENHEDEWSYTMPGYAWMLKKSRNVRTDKFTKDKRSRKFTKSTVGGILAAFIDEAKKRDNLRYIHRSFNYKQDSAGKAWGDTYTLSFDAGQDVYSILEDFTSKGMCDWRMHNRTLYVYKPNTFLARDMTNGDGDPGKAVVLRPYFDIVKEPAEITREDLARRILVQGDGPKYRNVGSGDNPGPWGAWEEYVTAGGWSSTRALDSIGNASLLARRGNGKPQGQRAQLTKEVHIREGSKLPVIQFRPGDYIKAPGYKPLQLGEDDPWTASLSKLRVQQITLNYEEPYGISGNLVLNDRFADRELKKERWLARVTGQT
ncbi:hypothetical protein [Streptomyces sp. 5-10]|uniref:hypothetical protein n=1 Tax=Streptomyces sp. 5-10 TaxID=878925 RepID=UPI00168B08BB|nr:hypothetical protein [Streptomyces sp. 5-10]MBD3004888.1 hypothetical protein [Streptomyces sp. 5-10]